MKLKFLGGGAAHGLVEAIAGTAGVDVDSAFGPVGGIRDRVLAGEACDIVILTHALVAELTAQGLVGTRPCSDLGMVRTSIAVRAGCDKPDVSDAEALRKTLLAADALYFPDPGKATAGIHFAKVIAALGIEDAVRGRLRTFPGGLPAMKALAASTGNALGCTQATEIVAVPGVAMVAPLPPGHELATVYTVALGAKCADPGAARSFVESLTGRDCAPIRAKAGFEGVAIRRAARGDEAAIRELVFDILAEYHLTPEPDGMDRDLFDVEAHYLSRKGNFDVGIDPDGRLVACCGVHPMDEARCELRKMYVRRDVRGQGLGRRLLERALAFARGSGYARMELETASVLKEAALLYESAGFSRLDRGLHAARCDRAYAMDLRG